MLVCPNCNHQNPSGAVQCEACYTPLPATMRCPNCGATVQTDASFCGQCGVNLKTVAGTSAMPTPSETPDPRSIPPEPVMLDPLVTPDSLVFPPSASAENPDESLPTAPAQPPELVSPPAHPVPATATQLQQFSARLLHLQTTNVIELPPGLPVIHIGKPNDCIPPDIDVSGYPDSEIVSRIHADIRAEGDAYYIEDVGSSNGTYINNVPLAMGNRHRLRSGDRISLGKGDKVTFLFQMA